MANSWRRERWDSLRLLTPNWQSRLPGYRYDGADPDGYMTMGEVIDFISRFAIVSAAPVRTHTTVTSVRQTDAGYHVATNNGDLQLPYRRAGERRLQCPERAGASSGRAGVHPVRHAVRLPQSECAAGRRRAGRRRVGHRCAARRRNPPLRPARDAFGRRARPAAEDVSRARRALVDGRVRRVEPALRRDRRSDACPEAPVAAARRHA